ncbi:hypothetical protein BGX26_011022 [Mortierella sp. AD094]|nr:hypothetical protein BGX26_011022 [Mortierella sp. AD094]
MSELQSNPSVMPQDRKKMLGILDRFEKQAIDQERMLDMSEDEILQQIQRQQRQQQQESLGKGATSRNDIVGGAAPRKLSSKERNELIRKTIEEEQKEAFGEEQYQRQGEEGSLAIDPEDREEMDRILEQEHQYLINRFQGVNLDEESFESIWARLSSEERREFRERFMISRLSDENDDEDGSIDTEEEIATGTDSRGHRSATVDDDEEVEARKLLQDMGETLKRGGEKVGESDSSNPMMADLDSDDLRAIRDAEISELIPIWKPWWEIEAEQAGQLKKVTVSQVSDKDESERLNAGTIDSIPQPIGTFAENSSVVAEKFVLDEEAMLRPHHALVQDLDEAERQLSATTVPRMARAPHPALIYHVCALLFAYVATSRVLNGDLNEEPEQTLAYIFDICPFFSPPLPTSLSKSSHTPSSPPTATTQDLPEVDDFETALAILQTSSLNSKLWKGDTLRLEMLSLLLRDLTLILARPSRSLRSIQQLKNVFNSCMGSTVLSSKGNSSSEGTRGKIGAAQKRTKLFSKSVLHRLHKKLEFYESYLVSDEYLLKTDRLDQVRTEVVMVGIRVRQEMLGWTQELENVTRVNGATDSNAADSGDVAGVRDIGARESSGAKKVLIEELS